MSTFAPIIIGATIVALVAIVAVLSRQGHGEDSADHEIRREGRGTGTIPRTPGSRPGGPGQAGQAVVAPGEIAPGDPKGRAGY